MSYSSVTQYQARHKSTITIFNCFNIAFCRACHIRSVHTSLIYQFCHHTITKERNICSCVLLQHYIPKVADDAVFLNPQPFPSVIV